MDAVAERDFESHRTIKRWRALQADHVCAESLELVIFALSAHRHADTANFTFCPYK